MFEKGSLSYSRGLITGMFDTDGTVIGNQGKGVALRLCQTELPRLEALQRLLLMFGIVGVLYKYRHPEGERSLPDQKGGYKMYTCKATHELHMSGANFTSFAEMIGLNDQAKMGAMQSKIAGYKRKPNAPKFFSPLESVQQQQSQEAFNCHVLRGNALFINGCIAKTVEN